MITHTLAFLAGIVVTVLVNIFRPNAVAKATQELKEEIEKLKAR